MAEGDPVEKDADVQTDATEATAAIQTNLSTELQNISNVPSALSSRTNMGLDEVDEFYKPIKFINIIFLPYHQTFKMFVLAAVIIKSTSGPLNAVWAYDTCTKLPQYDFLQYIKNLKKISDVIYTIDIILHMVHRQVVDEAVKREHLPKSMALLFVDILAVIPMRDLVIKSSCPDTHFWPNILSFNEVLIIYRVIEHFALQSTHSILKLLTGYGLFLFLVLHGASCFILLLTFHGLCPDCRGNLYDWRSGLTNKYYGIEKASEGYNAYILSTALAIMFVAKKIIDVLDPRTRVGFAMFLMFGYMTYWLHYLVCLPKTFAECILRAQKLAILHPRAMRIVREINRRNETNRAYVNVENFYDLSWKVHKGITCLPDIIFHLPRFLRHDVQQDLFWTIFYHSPTLRDTSKEYKRYIGDLIRLEFKLPGERFFTGVHCYTNMYYIKSGVVQFMSMDDNTSPLLSVTGGTVIGDVSFYFPPLNRKATVRCLTYCEVFVLSRLSIIKSNHMFPVDRFCIIKLAQGRIEHARKLYACKKEKQIFDRSEDEGIAWLKKQWWEIAHAVAKFHVSKQEASKCVLSSDHSHCPKYIGQLVLCSDNQLQSHSIFAKYSFPWIIFPNSSFSSAWHGIMQITVAIVVILYPPNLTRYTPPNWFKFLQFFVDLIYVGDILLSLVTATDKKATNKFMTVVIARCKTLDFVLSILSSPIIVNKFINPNTMLLSICTFNRLIKIHIFFTRKSATESWKKDPLWSTLQSLLCMQLICVYVLCYFLFILLRFLPDMSTPFFFGDDICPYHSSTRCHLKRYKVLTVFERFIYQLLHTNLKPSSYTDLGIGVIMAMLGFVIMVFIRSRFLAALYLKNKQSVRYHRFVATLGKHLIDYQIHPDLLIRLMQYLDCHLKHYDGVDVVKPIILIHEPREVYFKYHGAVAERVIEASKVFHNASPQLIRELAQSATFMLLPASTPLYLFGSKCRNVTWIVNGFAKCEYPDENGELVKTYTNNGEMLVPCAVFLGRASLRTFITETECEILSINVRDFYRILKRNNDDYILFENGVKELEPTFVRLFQSFVRKHQDYQKKLDSRIRYDRKTIIALPKQLNVQQLLYTEAKYFMKIEDSLFNSPENKFVKYWLKFRMVFVIISILNRALRGGAAVYFLYYVNLLESFCGVVTLFDITFKLFLPYYSEKGIIITGYRKCLLNYLSRGFIPDVLGGLPLGDMLQSLSALELTSSYAKAIETFTCYFHIYLVTGFFNYICGKPTAYFVLFSILKWQIVIFLLCCTLSNLFLNHCINFEWNEYSEIVSLTKSETCWIPDFFVFSEGQLLRKDLQFILAYSLYLAQATVFKVNMYMFHFRPTHKLMLNIFIVLGIIFWYISCFAQSLILLQLRGEDMFQNSLQKLVRFLCEERVEKPILDRVLNHFLYWWDRTNGIDTSAIMNGRIGVIFRQDVNFYMFRKTLAALDSILHGGEILQRQFSNNVTQYYCLEKEDIVREMQIMHSMHIVHRGSLVVTKNGETLTVLTKGAIIGQLDNASVRTMKITATTLEPTDLLEMPCKIFHELISPEIRQTIKNNPDSENDYLNLKKPILENPYDSIIYLLRGLKTIKLPRMSAAVTIQESAWYSWYLYMMYLWVTASTLFWTPVYMLITGSGVAFVYAILIFLDLIHLLYVISEFFTMELEVKNNKCVNVYRKWAILTHIRFYLDVISLVLPVVDLIAGQPNLQLFRMVRIYMFYEFQEQFTKNFQNKYSSILLKFVIIILVLHLLTCLWMAVACQQFDGSTVRLRNLPPYMNVSKTAGEWAYLHERKDGCLRLAWILDPKRYPGVDKAGVVFLKPKTWVADYTVALCFVAFLQTHNHFLTTLAVTTTQMYVNIVIIMILYFMELWIISVAISFIYSRYRDLYYYDFKVRNLLVYLKNNGLASALGESVVKYFQMSWGRNKGTWIPDIVQSAPLYVRQDIYSSLYMHHLKYSKVFQDIPDYFLSQLVVRMKRLVIFPGNTIVQEGEARSVMYFVHEGEVEQWVTDTYGDTRMTSVIMQNQCFGNSAGLLGTAYLFTYKTRTVADLVHLNRDDWADLRAAYPKITKMIEEQCMANYMNIKKRYLSTQSGKKPVYRS